MTKSYKELIKEINGSAKTSRNIIASGFKKVHWEKGTINFDLGGGKFDTSTEYLAEKGVTNLIYDPYNRSSVHNEITWQAGEEATTTTCFNVLNVVPGRSERMDLIKQMKRSNTKIIYITVYEKSGSGYGAQTRDGWQNNMKTIAYMEEIQEIYPQAKKVGKLITIIF